ncbi:uncharacterized protein LOC143293145 [Babylonia areolata]|uniref:uncharacterized protein LOC143293145 n=1 Tax=Babylonia areolata TaxID=304850 RepID=UPI003FCFFB77
MGERQSRDVMADVTQMGPRLLHFDAARSSDVVVNRGKPRSAGHCFCLSASPPAGLVGRNGPGLVQQSSDRSMKAAWALALSCAALMRASPTSGSAGVNESTTTWRSGSSSTMNTGQAESTAAVTITSDGVGTGTVRMSRAKPPPIYSTEFHRIWDIQSVFYLTLEPLALVLLTLSALAFLQDRKLASNCYLAAVCLCEAWYMLMLFVHYLCRQHPDCWISLPYVQLSIWSVSYTGLSARRCVYILNGLVSFQRYIAVAFPLKVRSFRFLHKARVSLTLVFVTTCLLHLYRPLQYTPVLIKDDKNQRWTQGFSPLFKAHKDTFLALADLSKYLTIYLPMLVCLLSNCLMIAGLSRHKKALGMVSYRAGTGTRKETDAAKSKVERQMTVTILTSTFLMVLLNSPININEAVSLYSHHYGMLDRDHYLYLVLRRCFSIVSQLCDILVTLTFLVLSTAFRRRFLALFRPLRRAACITLPGQPTSAAATGFSGTAGNSLATITTTAPTPTSRG